jgi:hypothetical protein
MTNPIRQGITNAGLDPSGKSNLKGLPRNTNLATLMGLLVRNRESNRPASAGPNMPEYKQGSQPAQTRPMVRDRGDELGRRWYGGK